MKFHRLSFSIFITGFICGIMGYATGCSTASVLHNKQQIDEAATIRKRVLSQTAPDPWSMSREEIMAELKARYPNAKAHLSFGMFLDSFEMFSSSSATAEIYDKLMANGKMKTLFIKYKSQSMLPSLEITASLTGDPQFSLESLRRNLKRVRSYDYMDDERLKVSHYIAQTIFGLKNEVWLEGIGTGIFSTKVRKKKDPDSYDTNN